MQNNFAIVLLTTGILGGAERRFVQLFKYLTENNSGKFFFIVSSSLYAKIIELYPGYPVENLISIGPKSKKKNTSTLGKSSGKIYNVSHPGFIKQVYRFINNFRIQKKYFREIEKNRKEKNIKCFLGVYSGILPLYFYLKQKKRDVGIIFCDMDSWFSDVLPRKRKYWYRKYSSFNFALENSDIVDFLSPFILQGIRDRGIEVKDQSVSITPCSFTDYSKCKIGDKTSFQVAFACRLEKDKNPDLFVEAAIKLSKKYPEILFHIMGEGRLSSDINNKVKNCGLNNIIHHGFHPQPADILADTSVFVSIQTTNNYPSQSVLEAMGCSNAIIASDVGDTRMFINEANGILIKLNTDDLVAAIEKLYLDKQLCRKMGEYGYNYVRENHTIEKMSEYYIGLFNKLNSKRAKG